MSRKVIFGLFSGLLMMGIMYYLNTQREAQKWLPGLYRSSDLGKTWKKVDKPVKLLWASPKGQIFAQKDGDVVVSSDKTIRWKTIYQNKQVRKMDIKAIWGDGRGSFFAVGDSGYLLHSPKGADAWTRFSRVSDEPLKGIWGTQNGRLWVVSKHQIYTSIDKQNWKMVQKSSSTFTGLHRGLGQTFWVTGTQGLLLRWNGMKWQKLPTQTQATLHSVWEEKAGLFVVGSAGKILHRPGNTGPFQPLSFQAKGLKKHLQKATLYGIWGLKDALLFTGSEGLLLRYHREKKTLKRVDTKTKWALLRISQSQSGILYIIGKHGTLLESRDKGKKWLHCSVSDSEQVWKDWFDDVHAIWPKANGGMLIAAGKHILASKPSKRWWLTRPYKELLKKGYSAPKAVDFWSPSPEKTLVLITLNKKGITHTFLFEGSVWEGKWYIKKHFPNQRYHRLWGLHDRLLFITGKKGRLLRSTDGGKVWDTIQLPVKGRLFGIHGNEKKLYLVGGLNTFFKSEDQGKHWKRLPVPKRGFYISIMLTSKGDLLLAGQRGRYNSHPLLFRRAKDKGTWEEVKSPFFPGQPDHLFELGPRLYVRLNNHSYRAVSEDAGKTWRSCKPGLKLIEGLVPHFSQGGWSKGCREIIVAKEVKSSNILKTWSGKDGRQFAMVRDGRFIVGTEPITRWEMEPSNWSIHIRGFWGPTEQEWFMVGGAGRILHTKNGGKSWSLQDTGTTLDLYAIQGNCGGSLYAVGNLGTILRYEKSSSRWIHEKSHSQLPLWELQCSPEGDVYAMHPTMFGYLHKKPGGKWYRKRLGKPLRHFVIDGELMFFHGSDGIVYSKDLGKSWTKSKSGYGSHALWSDKQKRVYLLSNYGKLLQWDFANKQWQKRGERAWANQLLGTPSQVLYTVVPPVRKGQSSGGLWMPR